MGEDFGTGKSTSVLLENWRQAEYKSSFCTAGDSNNVVGGRVLSFGAWR